MKNTRRTCHTKPEAMRSDCSTRRRLARRQTPGCECVNTCGRSPHSRRPWHLASSPQLYLVYTHFTLFTRRWLSCVPQNGKNKNGLATSPSTPKQVSASAILTVVRHLKYKYIYFFFKKHRPYWSDVTADLLTLLLRNNFNVYTYTWVLKLKPGRYRLTFALYIYTVSI